MNNERLFEAVAEISDRHILEFMEVKPQKSRKAVWISVISAAACLLLVITAVPVIKNFFSDGFIANVRHPPYNNMTIPLVIIDGTVYTYAGDDGDDLPEGFTEIGTVKEDKKSDFYSNACKPDEKIYADPSDPENIYVFTRLFHGENYWYVRFHKST